MRTLSVDDAHCYDDDDDDDDDRHKFSSPIQVRPLQKLLEGHRPHVDDGAGFLLLNCCVIGPVLICSRNASILPHGLLQQDFRAERETFN